MDGHIVKKSWSRICGNPSIDSYEEEDNFSDFTSNGPTISSMICACCILKFYPLDGAITLSKDTEHTTNATYVMEYVHNDVRKRVVKVPQIVSVGIFLQFLLWMKLEHKEEIVLSFS